MLPGISSVAALRLPPSLLSIEPCSLVLYCRVCLTWGGGPTVYGLAQVLTQRRSGTFSAAVESPQVHTVRDYWLLHQRRCDNAACRFCSKRLQQYSGDKCQGGPRRCSCWCNNCDDSLRVANSCVKHQKGARLASGTVETVAQLAQLHSCSHTPCMCLVLRST